MYIRRAKILHKTFSEYQLLLHFAKQACGEYKNKKKFYSLYFLQFLEEKLAVFERLFY